MFLQKARQRGHTHVNTTPYICNVTMVKASSSTRQTTDAFTAMSAATIPGIRTLTPAGVTRLRVLSVKHVKTTNHVTYPLLMKNLEIRAVTFTSTWKLNTRV